MLDRNDGTSWMNRGMEVLAHLRVVADEVDFVTVEAGGDYVVDAQLSVVSGETPALLLHLGDGSRLPKAEAGTVVKVSYYQAESSYEFLSVVHQRGEFGQLSLAVPTMVEQRERRSNRRLSVHSTGDVRLATDWGGTLVVYDISTSGLGLVGSPDDLQHAQGNGIRGVLALSDSLRVNVWLDVRHTRDLKTAGEVFIGARFMGQAERDVALIRGFIESRLSRR